MGSCASSSSSVAVPGNAFDTVSNPTLKRFKPPPQRHADVNDKGEDTSPWEKVRDALPDLQQRPHHRMHDIVPDKHGRNNRVTADNGRGYDNNKREHQGHQKEKADIMPKHSEEAYMNDSFSRGTTYFSMSDSVDGQMYPELEDIFDGFNQTVNFLKNNVDIQYFDAVYKKISSKILEPYKACWNKKHRRALAHYMAKIGFAKAFVKYYKHVLYVEQIEHYTGTEEYSNNHRLLFVFRDTAWRLISGSKKLAYKFGLARFVSMMLEDLKVISQRMDEKQISSRTRKAILSALAILYHCGKAESNKPYFKEGRATAVLQLYVHSADPEIKTAGILTLAHVMDETEILKLINDSAVIKYIINVIEKAMTVKSHRADGYSCLELVEGLTALALSDEMKRTLVQNGVLPHLTHLLEAGDAEEKEAATKALWTLAFHKENRQKLLEEPKLVPLLENLEKSTDTDEKRSAQGALFVIKEEQEVKGGQERMAKKAYRRQKSVLRLRKRLSRESSKERSLAAVGAADSNLDIGDEEEIQVPEEDIPQQHVMISYNWSDQKLMLKVKDYLRKGGYNVWMDVDGMGGSTLQAMAEAVEEAAVVLICMSEKYKHSPNCRTEAEYAYQLRKDIVPLLLQRSYKPDGWLGIILGAKLFFDFSGKYNFETKMEDLFRELGDKGKEGLIKAEEVVETGCKPLSRSVSQWETHEVRDWLREHSIRIKHARSLTGEQLIFLQKLNNKAPEFFYNYIQQELGLKDLADLMSFVNALEKL